MEQSLCVYCGGFFDPSPRHKNQTACKKVKCQRAKRAAWQRHRMKTDPIYRANQKSSQKQWARANSGYWREYREKNLKKLKGIESFKPYETEGRDIQSRIRRWSKG